LPEVPREAQAGARQPRRWPSPFPSGILEQLTVRQLEIGAGVAGQEAIFSVGGRLNSRTDDARVATTLQIQRIDGPEAKATITTSLKGEEPVLTVDAIMYEDAGGFLRAALGFRGAGAVHIQLHGEEPLAEWKGALTITVQDVGQAHATIGWSEDKGLSLTGEGALNPLTLGLPSSVVPLADEQANFALDLTYRDGREVSIHRAEITMNRVDLRWAGRADLKKKTVTAKFNLTVNDLSALESLLGTRMRGHLSTEGEVTGTFQRPQTRAIVTVRRLELAAFQASSITGDFLITPMESLVSPFRGLAMEGKGRAEDAKHQGWTHALQPTLQWSLAAKMPEKQRIVVDRFSLRGDEVSIDFAGEFNPRTEVLRGDAEIDVSDLRALSPLWGAPLDGTASVRTHLHAQGLSDSVVAEVDGYLKGVAPLPPAVAAMAESRIRYSGKIELVRGLLRITEFRLRSDSTEVAGEGDIDLLKQEVDGQMHVSIPTLTVLSKEWKKDLSGSLDAEGKIQGPLASPKLSARAVGRNILLEGIKLPRIDATLDAREVSRKSRGRVEVQVHLGDYLMQTSSAFAVDNERLTLSELSFTGGGSILTGNLSVNFQNRMLVGRLQGKADDLSVFSSLLGEELYGSATVGAVLSADKNGQDMKLDLSCRKLRTRRVHVEGLQLNANLKNVLEAPRGRADVTIEGIADTHKSLMVDIARVTLTGSPDKLNFSGNASGELGKDFELEGEGIVQGKGTKQLSLELARFQGRYDNVPVVLAEPVIFVRTPLGYELKDLNVALGSGTVRGSGSVGRDTIALAATFDLLPLGSTSAAGVSGLTGSASGEVRISGRPERPAGKVRLHVKDLQLKDKRFEPLGAASVTGEADLRDGLLRATFSVEGMENELIQAGLQLPLALSFSPLRFTVPPTGKIEGYLTGDVDLAYIPTVFHLDDHTLKGTATVELTMAGETQAPDLRGNAGIVKARYRHARTGTIFDEIDATLIMKEQKIILKELSAIDGDGGAVSATGWLELSPVKNFPLKLDLHLEKATLIRDDNITAASTGDVSVSGVLTGATIAGALDVAPADIRIPEKLPPQVVELNVVEINRPGEEKPPSQVQERRKSHSHQLDLQVNVPGRVYVRGRGLESEWKGKFRVTGNVDQPIMTGSLAVVRGHFDLFGKRFGLTKGDVTFAGNSPPTPQIDVTGELTKHDITARLQITGLFSEIRVKLESDPPLPEDEILAHILFGRSVARLTPMQALKLAQGLNRLSGAGGGTLDFMDRARRLLGVERLDVTQKEESSSAEATVTVGKYLTEGVYVEVDEPVGKEIGVEGTRFSVEVEVTPNISVESEGGLDAQGGVGLNWKWDY
jgi:translocation and assembly module TamB